MKLSLFFMGFLVSVGLTLAQQYGRGGSCLCTANYQPFCGTDEVTYSNKCELECAQRSNPSLRTKFEGVCAVPYVPENSNRGQTSGNYARPTVRPYTRPVVPPPAPRPTYNQYQARPNQGYVPPPQARPVPPPPPQTRPVPNRYPAPRPNTAPSWAPTYGQGFSGDD